MNEIDAIRMYPKLATLAAIRDAGWRFQHIADDAGELVGLVGWRNIRDATDALWIYDRADCRAVRLLACGPGTRGGIVWDYSGNLASCLGELLAIPEPDAPLAPRLIRSPAPSLWTP